MTVRIYTASPATPDFEFDITTDVSKTHTYTPTKRAIEVTGNVADHVYREPFTLSSNGFVAWTPISPRTYQVPLSTDESVLISMQQSLEAVAAKEDLVTLVCDLYTGPVVITSLQFSKGSDDGHKLMVSISFSEIQIAIPQTTQVNPSRLRPKVKKRAPKKGGQKATEVQTYEQYKQSFSAKGSTAYNATVGR